MFSRLVKPAANKPIRIYPSNKFIERARGLATVEGSAGRTIPARRLRVNPVSHDRATFTIRVHLQSTIESWRLGITNRIIIGWTSLPWQVLWC